jgi:hypothetical protein
MALDKTDKAKFAEWLHDRMKDSNFTSNEVKELTDWLEYRQHQRIL